MPAENYADREAARMTLGPILSIARRELATLVALALAAAGVLIFVQLADEISDQEPLHFDERLLLALRTGDSHDPIGPPWVEIMFTDITALGSFTVIALATIGVVGYLLIARKTGTALLVLAAIGGGALMNNLLKLVFDRARPDLVAHIVETHSTSFPSGHAMTAAVTYLTLGALIARVQASRSTRIYVIGVAVLLTVLIGVSRVYLGVHWPSDVLAGWSAGAAWAILCWTIAVFLQRRRKIDDPSHEAELAAPEAKPPAR